MSTSNPKWKRQLAAWSRWLHIYLSMFTFAIVFFFSVTGLTLNHVNWFDGQQVVRPGKGTVPREWLKPEVQKLEVVERLRKTHAIRNSITEFRVEDAQCAVNFKGPGYSADVFVNRETGAYEITETSMGLFAVLNDLHKGRDTGPVWSWVIDISAVLLVLVSFTGLVLIFFLTKKLRSGLIVAAAGALSCYLLYRFWTP